MPGGWARGQNLVHYSVASETRVHARGGAGQNIEQFKHKYIFLYASLS